MAKGLGIAALVVAVLGILVPVVTIYVVWLSLVLAAIAGLLGDTTFPIAATIASLVNIVFLSPMTWALFAGENIGGESFFMVTTVVLFISPVAAMIFVATKGKKKTVNTE